MKLTSCVTVGLLALSGSALAVYLDAPLDENIAEAQSVFIATITSGTWLSAASPPYRNWHLPL